MVTNTKDPLFGQVFSCYDIGPENLITENTQGLRFHYLNVTRVHPYSCSRNVQIGDHVISLQHIHYAYGAFCRYYSGVVTRYRSGDTVDIQITKRSTVCVPKHSAFKPLNKLNINLIEDGIRRFIASGIYCCRV